ncbi:MAG: LysR family transcriptional regulator [Rhodoferax sp.]|nr:LysR family transcriptional regulator [Rhodoferax sp.]
MNFQQLETFRWIARLGSFGRAAHKVNATQSTVSMRLAELEKELGIVLLDRTRRSVRVTPKGRDLLRYAEEIALLVSEIRHQVGDARKMSGTLRVGVAELIAMTWLPKLLHSIKKIYPLVDIELQIGLGGGMLSLLDAGELDLVLMPNDNQSTHMLRAEPLGKVRFGFVAAKELGLPARLQTPASLVKQPLITHGETSVLHGVLMQWCGQGDVQPTRIITSNSMEAAAMLAAAGLGVTFLPLAYYEPWIKQQRLQRVPVRPSIPAIQFSAVYPPGRQTPLVDAIVRLAMQHSTFSK